MALVGLLLAGLGFASFSQAAAVADPPRVASYTYDTPARLAALDSPSPEFGPPTHGYTRAATSVCCTNG